MCYKPMIVNELVTAPNWRIPKLIEVRVKGHLSNRFLKSRDFNRSLLLFYNVGLRLSHQSITSQ